MQIQSRRNNGAGASLLFTQILLPFCYSFILLFLMLLWCVVMDVKRKKTTDTNTKKKVEISDISFDTFGATSWQLGPATAVRTSPLLDLFKGQFPPGGLKRGAATAVRTSPLLNILKGVRQPVRTISVAQPGDSRSTAEVRQPPYTLSC